MFLMFLLITVPLVQPAGTKVSACMAGLRVNAAALERLLKSQAKRHVIDAAHNRGNISLILDSRSV